MNEIEISPGLLTALARLLVFLRQNPTFETYVAIEVLVSTRQIQTEQIAHDAERLAFELGLINNSSSAANLTQPGARMAIVTKDEDGMALERRLLLKILITKRRDLLWITFAKPNEIEERFPLLHQILDELRLLERNPKTEAIEFWKNLRFAGGQLDAAVLKKIGDEAEGWSMVFEQNRLSALGLSKLADEIVWVARESNLHGYDILSFSGVSGSPSERRHIEVKRCKTERPGYISFHFSRNEFDQSVALSPSYLLHLWWKDKKTRVVNLSVFDGQYVGQFVPKDYDSFNRWGECSITLAITAATETHNGVALVEEET